MNGMKLYRMGQDGVFVLAHGTEGERITRKEAFLLMAQGMKVETLIRPIPFPLYFAWDGAAHRHGFYTLIEGNPWRIWGGTALAEKKIELLTAAPEIVHGVIHLATLTDTARELLSQTFEIHAATRLYFDGVRYEPTFHKDGYLMTFTKIGE